MLITDIQLEVGRPLQVRNLVKFDFKLRLKLSIVMAYKKASKLFKIIINLRTLRQAKPKSFFKKNPISYNFLVLLRAVSSNNLANFPKWNAQ